MKLDVKERGQAVATYRGILVSLMETVARFVPTTPEMEVKLLFGGLIWDLAQHADALGKRTHELRLPLQHSIAPTDEYRALLAEVAGATGTGERIAALYDVFLPGLAVRYRGYLAATDHLMDAPTVRILDRVLYDTDRMLAARAELAHKLPHLPVADAAWVSALASRERAATAIASSDAATIAEPS